MNGASYEFLTQQEGAGTSSTSTAALALSREHHHHHHQPPTGQHAATAAYPNPYDLPPLPPLPANHHHQQEQHHEQQRQQEDQHHHAADDPILFRETEEQSASPSPEQPSRSSLEAAEARSLAASLRSQLEKDRALYQKAYRALNDELIKAQIEQSVLRNIKIIAESERNLLRHSQR